MKLLIYWIDDINNKNDNENFVQNKETKEKENKK